jgi:DNA-directed RNA polymerase subunit E'/Rpb7
MENMDIYTKMVLYKQLSIRPNEISSNINQNLEKCLREEVEGICVKEGYVRPNSVKIISRSQGELDIVNFNGNTTFTVRYEVDICNPQIGQIIECQVDDNNKSQVDAFIDNIDTTPININLPRTHHLGNSEFVSLKSGDIIRAKVIGKGFKYKDKSIIVIAHYLETI